MSAMVLVAGRFQGGDSVVGGAELTSLAVERFTVVGSVFLCRFACHFAACDQMR